jgi:hypothetical protein
MLLISFAIILDSFSDNLICCGMVLHLSSIWRFLGVSISHLEDQSCQIAQASDGYCSRIRHFGPVACDNTARRERRLRGSWGDHVRYAGVNRGGA